MKDYSQRFLSETVRLSKGCGASAGILWTNLALPNGSAITNVFNGAGMLTGTYLKNSGGSILNKHVYTYNTAGQRNQQTRTDSRTWCWCIGIVGAATRFGRYPLYQPRFPGDRRDHCSDDA